jgi:hypothetical protein
MRKLFLLLVVLAMSLRAGTADADSGRSRYLFRLPDSSGPAQPEPKYRGAGEDRIPDQYIVVLSDDVLPNQVPDVARALGLGHQFTPRKIWQETIKGFFAEMPEARARALSNNPLVKYVEENAQWHLSATTQQTNINPVTCDPTVTTCMGSGLVTDNRLWHLDRADQNYADPTNSYSYCTDGTGVTVYVVDFGVNKNHQEFGGRVMPGYNATAPSDSTTDDHMPADNPCLGFIVPFTNSTLEISHYQSELTIISHGTAVASAVGGKRVGIAKNVTIVPIKTARCDLFASRARLSNHFYPENKTMFRSQNGSSLDALYRCITPGGGATAQTDPGGWPTTPGATILDGGVTWKVLDPAEYLTEASTNMIIDGLNWILRSDNPGPKSHAIVTMSIFRRSDLIAGQLHGIPTTIEEQIQILLANNITVIVSANNQNGNACDTSPSRMSVNNPDPNVAKDVITVAGSMVINRPWNVNLGELPAIPTDGTEADGGGGPGGIKGLEPAYDATKAVRDGRWICGAGDSNQCSNTSPVDTPAIDDPLYSQFEGGSNAGACVTLFAPAKNLFLATTTGSGSDYRDPRVRGGLASGTSWSAPIVAGFAARILQNHPTFTPTQVRAELLSNCVSTLDAATLNSTDSHGTPITGTPNKLLRLGDVNITTQPVSQTATSSETKTLSVLAGGTSTVSYQWYQVNNGFDLAHWTNGAHFDTGSIGSPGSSSTKILGATSSTYQTQPSNTTTGYWARATNSCGSADTDIAIVTIVACTPPAISTHPQSLAVPAGTGVTLSVGATGTSLAYQWFIGTSGVTTTPVGGATAASVNVAPSSTTTYWVRVSNSCGTVDSASATVTLQPIAAANFFLLSPCRVLDTRGGTPLPANGVMNLVITGKCSVPAGATAAAINVTVVSPAVDGLVTLYPGPANTVKPVVSTINYTAGRTLANNARITVGVDGSINIFNAAGTPLDFLIDLSGFFK